LKKTITFKINGIQETIETETDKTLLKFIREDLYLTGTKEGCGEGECGACTVIVDGKAVNSCLMLAPEIDGKELWTVEGLRENGELSDLQKMFIEHHAFQCGFCTPGMLMSAKALLDSNPEPSEEEIKEAIAGNLCRCTGYQQIINAIKAASKLTKVK
jgi:carbon-monoxide dehydrogenase small subunit